MVCLYITITTPSIAVTAINPASGTTAKQLVMDVGRMDEERFSENEDVVRTAMLYTVSYLYENRNNCAHKNK